MAACSICGKKTSIGRSQQHKRGVAGKRWKKRVQSTPRTFKVNLQNITYIEKGKEVKAKVCTKCIKRLKRDKKLKSQQVSL